MVHVFINLEEEENGHLPMCDMTFEITGKQYDDAASCWRLTFHADASPSEPVGFGALIPMDNWKHQIDGEGEDAFHSYWGPVSLFSTGIESDNLIALIADYYGIDSIHEDNSKGIFSKLLRINPKSEPLQRSFANRIDCFAVGINSDPSKLAEQPVHMKLFFDDGLEGGRYAEVFLDIDLMADLAALNEKDEEYRTDLVSWLSQAGVVEANPYGRDKHSGGT